MVIPVPHFHRVTARDHYCIDLIKEQTVLHDAGDRGDRGRDFSWLRHLIQSRVQDVIALIREGGRPTDRAKSDAGAEFGQARTDELGGKGYHLHWQRELPEHRNELAGIDYYDHAGGRGRYDLLTEQRATAALDGLEAVIDFIGAVDRKVDRAEALKGDKRHP